MQTIRTELDERFSSPGVRPTSWDRTRSVLEAAQVAWITTIRRDGRPHVAPLVPLWLDDTIFFSTGSGEQKAVNLSRCPHVILTIGDGQWRQGLDIVVEGDARRITDRTVLERLEAVSATRWDGRWRYQIGAEGFLVPGEEPIRVFAIQPTKILAFGRGEEGFSQVSHRPERADLG